MPLKDCMRVLDGFGKSLEVILPKLREGFVAPDSDTARSLALSNPQCVLPAPSGETFHNVTVTGGRPREQGPLALKRELRRGAAEAVEGSRRSSRRMSWRPRRWRARLRSSTRRWRRKTHERREAERRVANSGAALRQMESEAARIERRLQEWPLASERNGDAATGEAGPDRPQAAGGRGV